MTFMLLLAFWLAVAYTLVLTFDFWFKYLVGGILLLAVCIVPCLLLALVLGFIWVSGGQVFVIPFLLFFAYLAIMQRVKRPRPYKSWSELTPKEQEQEKR